MSNPAQPADRRALLQQALQALEEMQAKLDQVERARHEPIAIVGMGCRFPGGADTLDAFWRVLRDGVDTVTEIPATRWDADAFYDPDPDVPGKMYTRRGAFLEAPVDLFDAPFFGIAPREATSMDPQQRLLLEVSWEALEHAAIDPKHLAGSRTGVFIGMCTNDYANIHARSGGFEGIDGYFGSGIAHSIAAGRISYILGLHGPSIAVDTACSSSSVAIHLAIQSLRTGESAAAIAGGVSLVLTPDGGIATSRGRMISPDGHCKTFDASADGYVRGEGCGIVVLKRLADAQAAGDRVLAVIRGSALNQDGRSNGLTAPNGLAQEQVILEALKQANVAPNAVGYVEAHGTGTSLGDPIEMRALGAALGSGRSAEHPLLVGSVKTNIGHLEAAAGVAGLIKTVLTLQHQTIPPHLHFERPNPYIPWSDLPITVPTVAIPWHTPERRIAGVSSFGFSGTNAHLVVEEAPATAENVVETTALERPHHLLALSAHSAPALAALAERYRTYCADHPQAPLADLCYTANIGRNHFPHRLIVAADSIAHLHERLAADSAQPQRWLSEGTNHDAPAVAFLFTGQGAQYPGMAKQLYASQPVFRAAIDRCATILVPHLDRPLNQILFQESANDIAAHPLHQTAYTQPALFAVEYALAELWQAWGIVPQAVMGHSVGEYVAAVLAGVFSLEDGLALIAARGRFMQQLPVGGSMVAIFADPSRVQAAIHPYANQIAIAAFNGPGNTVISGDADAVAVVSDRFVAEGVRVQRLVVSHAFHSPLMEPMLEAFARVAATVRYHSPKLPLISNVSGQLAGADVATAEYWVRHVRSPVQFAAGMSALHQLGCDTFVEIGPHPVLLAIGQSCLPDVSATWLPSLRRGQTDWKQLLESLALLYVRGVTVNWMAFDQPYVRQKLALPTYPFQRRRYWIEAQRHAVGNGQSIDRVSFPSRTHPLLGQRIRSPFVRETVFETQLGPFEPPYLSDHRLNGVAIFPATGYLEMALAAAASFGDAAYAIEHLTIREPLVLPDHELRKLQFVLTPETETSASFSIASLEEAEEPAPGWSSSSVNARTHVQGALRRLPTGLAAPAPFSAEALRGDCNEQIDPETYYEQLRAIGMEYGAAFRGLISLYAGDNQALALIQLPEPFAAEANAYQYHPALLDACLQTIGGAVQRTHKSDSAASTYMPVAIENLQVYGRLTSQVWCHVRIHTDGTTSDDSLAATLQIIDAHNRTVLTIERLVLRRANPARTQRATDTTDQALYRPTWRTQVLPDVATADARGTWVLLADAQGVAQQLASRLEARGATCVFITPGTTTRQLDSRHWQVDPYDPHALDAPLGDALLRGVIHLWSLNASDPQTLDELQAIQARISGSALHAVQTLANRAGKEPRFWLITRGAQSVDGEPSHVAAAALWGLGRVIATEYPALHCTCIDLDAASLGDPSAELAGELLAASAENGVALRGGRRLVARLARYAPATTLPDDQPYQLTLPARGSLDNLAFVPLSRRSPGPDDVEIATRATGLNFRDVLNVLGMYPGDPGAPGLECAGIITAVGSHVRDLHVGDSVIALATHAFDSHIVAPAKLVTPIPAPLSFAEAVTIPSAFLTAAYGLQHLARIQPGERVLIHAAAGGVGLAAVQLALRAGAEVFATAGSPEKHAFLRALGVQHIFSSRTLDFADAILEQTAGQGVDVVLNSLADEFITRSIDVLSRHGRFLEIGKRGIWTQERFAAARPQAAYYPFELSEVLGDQPGFLEGMLRELLAQCASGALKPLPVRAFPTSALGDAFRFMAQARHIGKIVVTHQPSRPIVRSDSTYLITGGFGGLGLQVAQWLHARGARHLALVGRSGPNAEAEAILAALRGMGTTIHVFAADVANPTDVARMLGTLGTSAPPLRGIIHAAGVLDDGVLAQQSVERFARVFAPKANGAWLLDELTRGMPLDFFVLFSSAAALLGAPGQANYAAANAMLDALAHRRQATGLPALSINWGAWGEVGMVAALGARDQRRTAARGIGILTPDEGVSALERLLEQDAPQVGVLPIDWPTLLAQFPADNPPPFFAELAQREQREAPTTSDLLQELATAAPTAQRAILMEHVQQQIAHVLGIDPTIPIDPRQGLTEIGMDSLMAVELSNRLRTSVKRSLPATLAFEHPTLSDLTTFLATDILDLPPEAPLPPSPSSMGPSLADELEQLSEEEAEDILLRELEESGY